MTALIYLPSLAIILVGIGVGWAFAYWAWDQAGLLNRGEDRNDGR